MLSEPPTQLLYNPEEFNVYAYDKSGENKSYLSINAADKRYGQLLGQNIWSNFQSFVSGISASQASVGELEVETLQVDGINILQRLQDLANGKRNINDLGFDDIVLAGDSLVESLQEIATQLQSKRNEADVEFEEIVLNGEDLAQILQTLQAGVSAAATKAYTDERISSLIGGIMPSTLDTLYELSNYLSSQGIEIASILEFLNLKVGFDDLQESNEALRSTIHDDIQTTDWQFDGVIGFNNAVECDVPTTYVFAPNQLVTKQHVDSLFEDVPIELEIGQVLVGGVGQADAYTEKVSTGPATWKLNMMIPRAQGVRYRFDWESQYVYYLQDIVKYDDAVYICIVNQTTNRQTPLDSSEWDILVFSGEDGRDGADAGGGSSLMSALATAVVAGLSSSLLNIGMKIAADSLKSAMTDLLKSAMEDIAGDAANEAIDDLEMEALKRRIRYIDADPLSSGFGPDALPAYTSFESQIRVLGGELNTRQITLYPSGKIDCLALACTGDIETRNLIVNNDFTTDNIVINTNLFTNRISPLTSNLNNVVKMGGHLDMDGKELRCNKVFSQSTNDTLQIKSKYITFETIPNVIIPPLLGDPLLDIFGNMLQNQIQPDPSIIFKTVPKLQADGYPEENDDVADCLYVKRAVNELSDKTELDIANVNGRVDDADEKITLLTDRVQELEADNTALQDRIATLEDMLQTMSDNIALINEKLGRGYVNQFEM